MRLTVTPAGARSSPAHPSLEAQRGIAVSVRPAGEDAFVACVSFRVPRAAASGYARLHEAVALLVDIPDEAATLSTLLVDREVHRQAPGPNWLGAPPPAEGFPSWIGGWATATIRVAAVARPTTLYVRAALRDLVSPACQVALSPPPPAPAAPSPAIAESAPTSDEPEADEDPFFDPHAPPDEED